MEKVINNLNELSINLDTPIEGIKRTIYKFTNCGAWIKFCDDGIKLGSIVEGSDFETQTYKLTYPFLMNKFWNILQKIEEEASILWDEANREQEE